MGISQHIIPESDYLVIWRKGGDTRIDALTRVEVEKALEQGAYGENVTFFSSFEDIDDGLNDNTSYWDNERVLIVKGKAVVPNRREFVVKYELPTG